MNDQTPEGGRGNGADVRRSVLHTSLRRLFTRLTPPTVPCVLRYSTDDPFAVALDVAPASAARVTWTVARDLLAQGMTRPSGEGDFRVWPSGAHQDADRRLYFSLDRPAGHATFETDLLPVRRWLDATYELVPAGSEGDLMDWRALEESLLGN
ncbi:SsgA family sporulation/cell division regulator [Streptomyces sp. VRA16 Mangrove soil]|uniref:SsgA family sporulation/cell division regulator n=1 Tax=Streptomyces sp. VRA16 Mangrove soil TaxID=2817434 RepID=UPI001A9F6DD2|nr:SsgA family sporulation/cell division regulator [Streptomyces sp. VRA16 Mangrove soil]MBO1331218.1 SsgA family sporulation/cell division regulator [Streptomyces sp. VRA16 Mangrove soil]